MKKHFLSLLSITFLSFVLTSAHAAHTITAEGVGPIKLGMKIKDIPSSINGFYDNLQTQTRKSTVSWSGKEYTETFYLATLNGKPVFEIPYSGFDRGFENSVRSWNPVNACGSAEGWCLYQ